MRLPALRTLRSSMDGVTAFKGYNHGIKPGENEFYDMGNITSEYLPVIAARGKRGRVRTMTKCNGLFAHEKLCWVDGTDFYYNGEIEGTVADSPKQFVRMGAHVLIWPDKLMYNVRTGGMTSLDARFESGAGAAVTAVLSKADGTAYATYTVSDTTPVSPADGALWLDTSGDKDLLKQFSTTTSMWTSVATTYVKISATGIGTDFAEFDGVTISGMDNEALNGSFYLSSRSNDWIVITAIIREAITENVATVKVERKAPDMDYICESNNRLWGASSAENEIYGSALGDPTNWRRYAGISTDSYAVTVGSGGPFTGAVALQGDVLFFKEDAIHRIIGTMPKNYTLYTTSARGVGAGCAASLKVVNEALYYLGDRDVCLMGSTLPVAISAALGATQYHAGVCGKRGKYLYMSAQDETGAYSLLVFDTEAGVWVREDATDARWFGELDGELYFVAANVIWSVGGTLTECPDEDARMEDDVPWMLETGDIGIDTPFNMHIAGMQLYAQTESGGTLRVEVQYNAAGAWDEVYRAAPESRRAMTIPITLKRCRTMRLRISGTGEFKMWSMVRRIAAGSDRYGA